MKSSFVYKITAPVILLVFTITSCTPFVMPGPDRVVTVSVPTVTIGKGDIQFVFLDEYDQPTTTDIGRMAMVIENNDAAQGVLVVAEIYGNNLDNDMVVRVINRNNNSIVSVFYRSRMFFPHSIFMTVDGENISGTFSNYNPGTQTYSVTFTDDYDDKEIFENLVLNRNVFTLHQNYDGLSDTQNARLQNIITTLALWNSLAFQIEEDFEVVGIVPANIFRSIRNNLRTVFVVVAVVAFAAVIILAPPATVTVSGSALTVSTSTTTQLIAAGNDAVDGAAMIPYGMPAGWGTNGHSAPDKNDGTRPSIQITKAGTDRTVANNGAPHYLALPTSTAPGGSVAFDIRIADPAGQQTQDIIMGGGISEFVLFYDPFYDRFISPGMINSHFFVLALEGSASDNTLRLTITRNSSTGPNHDGRIQFVLFFRQAVSINGNNRGYVVNNNIIEANAEIGNLFIFNFTAL
jgi:hypothetical protein